MNETAKLVVFLSAIRLYFGIGIAAALRLLGFLADYFLIVLGFVPVWAFVMPGIDINDAFTRFVSPNVDVHNLTFNAPALILLGYVVIGLVVYLGLYRKVTTYWRWLYAIRVLILTIISIALLAVVIKLGLEGRIPPSFEDSVGVVFAMLVFLLVAWLLTSLHYLVSVTFTFKLEQDERSPKTLIFPWQMVSILIRRRPDFAPAPSKPSASAASILPQRKSKWHFGRFT